MNDDTLVVIQAYEGDKEQAESLLHGWLHHGCPVLIISPADSRVEIGHPRVECRWAGQRGWGGMHTIERQIEHLRIISEYPQHYVLYNDTDSFCLKRRIPRYLYDTDDVFYSNEQPTKVFFDSAQQLAHYREPDESQIGDAQRAAIWLLAKPNMDSLQARQPSVYQPPYFFHQNAVRRMLTAANESKTEKNTFVPLIDWWWARVVEIAKLRYRSFPDGLSGFENDLSAARGYTMVHSINQRSVLDQLLALKEEE